MDEKEFDQKIRESAQRLETQAEKPLWDKEGVWNRIDSGLEKKNHSGWWKAVAVILVLLSCSWSFALWNEYRNYRHEKDTEIAQLKAKFESSISHQARELDAKIKIIQKKDMELEFMKIQRSKMEESKRKLLVQSKTQNQESRKLKNVVYQDQLIDSLRNEIRMLREVSSNSQPASLTQNKETVVEPESANPRVVSSERTIYFISSHNKPVSDKKGKTFKIDLFSSPGEKDVEYQSGQSIFKK
jgi:hypothetical protein